MCNGVYIYIYICVNNNYNYNSYTMRQFYQNFALVSLMRSWW